jgi:hypothetical protein
MLVLYHQDRLQPDYLERPTSFASALLIAFKSDSGKPFFCAGTTFFLLGITSLRAPLAVAACVTGPVAVPPTTVVAESGTLSRILGVGSERGCSEIGVCNLIIVPGCGSGLLIMVISAILMNAIRIDSSMFA